MGEFRTYFQLSQSHLKNQDLQQFWIILPAKNYVNFKIQHLKKIVKISVLVTFWQIPLKYYQSKKQKTKNKQNLCKILEFLQYFLKKEKNQDVQANLNISMFQRAK
eukprot:TRINITY_DN4324_c0_g1_i5.p1 TRINITY_DN4324_c0_g1~~TRINITY_DN4324_c0_g1_i5.p1  ORF type:complete len:106 (-),score=7.76 TRINITY_DN4324_c0_g1_i5:97-414(-)